MRKLPAVLAVVGLVAVGLVGCSASAPAAASCSRQTATDTSTTDLITVKGAADSAPRVTVHTPFHTDTTVFDDITRGTGPAITEAEQLVQLEITFVGGETGNTLYALPEGGIYKMSGLKVAASGLEDALMCATEGSRIVVALAPDDISAEMASGIGLSEGESVVLVVDVRKVFPTKADGADQYSDAHGLPTVVRAPDGRPGIIIPDATPPSKLVAQTIKKGSGAVVVGDETLILHYTNVRWSDRSVVETTWDDGPKAVTLDTMDPGFAEAITGQTIGSQVLVVIPPEKDDDGKGETQVYVVDILGVNEAAPAQ